MYIPVYSIKSGWILGKIENHISRPLTDIEIDEVCQTLNKTENASLKLLNDILRKIEDYLKNQNEVVS